MNKKVVIPIIVIVIVAAAGFLIMRGGDSSEKSDQSTSTPGAQITENTNPTPPATPTPTQAAPTPQPTPPPQKGQFSDEEDVNGGEDTQVFEIKYNGEAYTPNALTIKQGDIVAFKNESSGTFWPASSPHPMHTDYPEFDPKQPVAAGKTFQIKFMKAGTWKFHDHLNPTARGTITVTQ